jgi:serine/threonine-protein phosphatase PGAM5
MTHFLYVVRHGEASPHDGPLSDLGRRQARCVGERLGAVPMSAIYHGPLERAAQTAAIIAEHLPGVPVLASDLAGDYIPADPDPAGLPEQFVAFLRGFGPAERAEGRRRAREATEFFGRPSGEADTHTLLVTHNFLVGWLVSQAMAGPDWRWLGTNQMNCALSLIAYQPELPPALVMFNDAAHLPPELRWTGYPASLSPGSSY